MTKEEVIINGMHFLSEESVKRFIERLKEEWDKWSDRDYYNIKIKKPRPTYSEFFDTINKLLKEEFGELEEK